MSVERLHASYIVRVTVRGGERKVQVMNLRNGETVQLAELSELSRHLELADSPESADEPPKRRNRR